MYRQIGLDMGKMATLQDGGRLCYRVKVKKWALPTRTETWGLIKKAGYEYSCRF